MSNDVLLEIGLEELPARFIDNAMEQLVEHCEHWLHENRLKFDKIIPYSTPRRLAIIVENIADSQETLSEEVRGPSKQIDRKSTRLNSSHVAISYAVFCLKKKTSQSITNMKTRAVML